MSSIPAEVTADILNGVVQATAPATESPEARGARARSLQAALAAFQAKDMQEFVLAAEILAGHFIAMVRFRDAGQAAPGSVQASRLLRDGAAAQRMVLTANRALRLWRATMARVAAPSRKAVHSTDDAAAPMQAAAAMQTRSAASLPASPASGAIPRVIAAPKPAEPALLMPGMLPAIGREAASSYKSALRSSVAVPAL